MGNKLFEQHEAARGKSERQASNYDKSLSEIGSKVQTHKDGTPAMENAHHGRKGAGEGRRK